MYDVSFFCDSVFVLCQISREMQSRSSEAKLVDRKLWNWNRLGFVHVYDLENDIIGIQRTVKVAQSRVKLEDSGFSTGERAIFSLRFHLSLAIRRIYSLIDLSPRFLPHENSNYCYSNVLFRVIFFF